ncbi:glycosyltransferase family 2 protein [bacterium]|nr:glycosyltransferase family 2 protein [candidate division CSSED10-310 bacterium]
MNVDISVIIVNFNTVELLSSCIDSILKSTHQLNVQIIIVDNASTDGSCEMIETRFPFVNLIRNTRNNGFSMANNQGLQLANGDYVFLLNPDTEIQPNTLGTLYDFLKVNSDTGAVGPRTFLDRHKTLEVCSLKIPSLRRMLAVFTSIPFPWIEKELRKCWEIDFKLWEAENACEVEGIGGAAFFTDRKSLLDIGGLDERFFMGYEDSDLAAVFKKQSKKIKILPKTFIVHYFGQSKQHPEAPKQEIYNWDATPVKFLRKHSGIWSVVLLKSAKIFEKVFFKSHVSHSPYPPEILKSAGDHKIVWDGSPEIRYLFELSNTPLFFDKFAGTCTKPEFFLPESLLNRLAKGKWYWRVYRWPASQTSTTEANGSFVLF